MEEYSLVGKDMKRIEPARQQGRPCSPRTLRYPGCSREDAPSPYPHARILRSILPRGELPGVKAVVTGRIFR